MRKDVISIRISDGMKDRLQKVGEQENRSVSNVIELAIIEYFRNHGYTDSTEKGK